ncbi:HupE/UreJ family protein [Hyalangium gracile]|uniref:HupE/UreJ family protein n=1 Tax=Hyalangium gracile TaxID=394092 RepID=UPI001CCFC594|nr:HupE/UreJ family protein [Hyalangium gracile]
MKRHAAWLLLAVVLGSPAPVAAHQFAPALLSLEEVSASDIEVSWKQPIVRVQGSQLRPVLPIACTGVGAPAVRKEGTGMRATWRLRCPEGLAGKTVGVEGIASSQADVLLRITLRDGRQLRQVLTAKAPSFEVRAGSGRLGVLRDYATLGVEHILTGWDHLLFVLGLVLLVGWGSRLLWTVTAFTLGHSVTLGLASLGLVTVPQAPMEAAIALSIYVLAVELTRRREGQRTFTQRAPWLVASGFGLLHGLGFAGALSEVGLPPAEIPLSLFSFNAGIELGQLVFISAVLLLTAALRRLPITWPKGATAAPAYAIGILAAFWFFERVAGL